MLPLLAAYMGASALGSMGKGQGLSEVPLIGGLFSNPAQEDFEAQLRANGRAWEARRPVLAQQSQALMGHVKNAYAPAQAALSQMYAGTQIPGKQANPMDAVGQANIPNVGGPMGPAPQATPQGGGRYIQGQWVQGPGPVGPPATNKPQLPGF